MFTGILKKAIQLSHYIVLLVSLAGVCIIHSGCANKPSGLFSKTLSKAGIQIGKPFVVQPGMQVRDDTTPAIGEIPAQKLIVFKDAVIGIGGDDKVASVFISNPDNAGTDNASLSAINLRTSDGTSLFRLSEADIKRLFGRPNGEAKSGQLSESLGTSAMPYYYVTSNQDVISVMYLFAGAERSSVVDTISIELVKQDWRRKSILESGKFKVYDW